MRDSSGTAAVPSIHVSGDKPLIVGLFQLGNIPSYFIPLSAEAKHA